MAYHAKLKVNIIDADNGVVTNVGATMKYSISPTTQSASTAITLDEYLTLNPQNDSTVLNFLADSILTNYSFAKYTVEIKEFYNDGYIIMSTPNSTQNPYGGLDIKDYISRADSADHATIIEVHCHLNCTKKKLHYDANGGTGAPADQEFTAGTSFTLSATAPTKTGSTFQGWNVAGTTTKYAKSASVNFQHNTTLYAMWTATDYQKDAYYGALVYKV